MLTCTDRCERLPNLHPLMRVFTDDGVGRAVYTALKLPLNMEFFCFIQIIHHSEAMPVLP